jgi:hypothetical protein
LIFDIPLNTFCFSFGVFLIVLEVMLIPGIGSIFAGLGAITVGGFLLAGGWIDTTSSQFIVFFLSTGVWAVLLTKGCFKIEVLVSHQYSHRRFLWKMEQFITHQYLLRRLLWKLRLHLIINSHKIKSYSIPI